MIALSFYQAYKILCYIYYSMPKDSYVIKYLSIQFYYFFSSNFENKCNCKLIIEIELNFNLIYINIFINKYLYKLYSKVIA